MWKHGRTTTEPSLWLASLKAAHPLQSHRRNNKVVTEPATTDCQSSGHLSYQQYCVFSTHPLTPSSPEAVFYRMQSHRNWTSTRTPCKIEYGLECAACIVEYDGIRMWQGADLGFWLVLVGVFEWAHAVVVSPCFVGDALILQSPQNPVCAVVRGRLVFQRLNPTTKVTNTRQKTKNVV